MEYVTNILGVLCILLFGALGAEAKGLRSMVQAFVAFAAAMVGVRYWEVGTKLTMGVAPIVGVAAPLWFFVVFGTCLLVGLNLADWIATKAKHEMVLVVDQVAGFVFGIVTGTFVACSVLLAVSVPLIKWAHYDPGRVHYHLERFPLIVYESAHKFVTGQPALPAKNSFLELVWEKEELGPLPEIKLKRRAAPEIPSD